MTRLVVEYSRPSYEHVPAAGTPTPECGFSSIHVDESLCSRQFVTLLSLSSVRPCCEAAVEAQAAILHAAQVELGRLKQAVEAMAAAAAPCGALQRYALTCIASVPPSPPTPPLSSGKNRRHSIKARTPPPFPRGGASDRAGFLLRTSTRPTLNLLLLNRASV